MLAYTASSRERTPYMEGINTLRHSSSEGFAGVALKSSIHISQKTFEKPLTDRRDARIVFVRVARRRSADKDVSGHLDNRTLQALFTRQDKAADDE